MKQFNTLFTFKLLFLSILEIHNTLLSKCYVPLNGLESNRFKQEIVQIALLQQYSAEF